MSSRLGPLSITFSDGVDLLIDSVSKSVLEVATAGIF